MKKETIIKIVSLILTIVVLLILFWEVGPLFRNISTESGRIIFKNKIESMGAKGIFIIIGLMIAQIFLAFLPGEPVELLAGMCYGPIGGVIIILVGAFISTFLIFFIIKKFGKTFIVSFISEKKIEKIEQSTVFNDTKTMYYILFILFFIPGTPKDLLVYIGGILPVDTRKFLCIATFARIPSIISSTIAGSNIIKQNWFFIGAIYVITLLFSGTIIYFINKKNKQIIEVIR